MRTRLTMILAVGAAAALLALALPWPDHAAPTAPARSAASAAPALARPAARPPRPAPATTAAAPSPDEPWHRSFEAATARVAEDCGLPVRAVCDDRGCAAITTAPDLDRVTGWLRLLARNPRLVVSTAARDLGVPASALPCGAALGVFGAAPATVELPDGTEVWCLPTDAAGETRWDAGQRALCDDAAAELLGPRAAGFGAERLRILRFDRSGPG